MPCGGVEATGGGARGEGAGQGRGRVGAGGGEGVVGGGASGRVGREKRRVCAKGQFHGAAPYPATGGASAHQKLNYEPAPDEPAAVGESSERCAGGVVRGGGAVELHGHKSIQIGNKLLASALAQAATRHKAIPGGVGNVETAKKRTAAIGPEDGRGSKSDGRVMGVEEWKRVEILTPTRLICSGEADKRSRLRLSRLRRDIAAASLRTTCRNGQVTAAPLRGSCRDA